MQGSGGVQEWVVVASTIRQVIGPAHGRWAPAPGTAGGLPLVGTWRQATTKREPAALTSEEDDPSVSRP